MLNRTAGPPVSLVASILLSKRTPCTRRRQRLPLNATVYEYEPASQIVRATRREAVVVDAPETGTIVADTTQQSDEGGFNYETRQRIVVGLDDGNDPVTGRTGDPLAKRELDWAGNVTAVTSQGDGTVASRVMEYTYDGARRRRRQRALRSKRLSSSTTTLTKSSIKRCWRMPARSRRPCAAAVRAAPRDPLPDGRAAARDTR